MFGVHLMESNPDENNVKDNTFILSPDKVKYISCKYQKSEYYQITLILCSRPRMDHHLRTV